MGRKLGARSQEHETIKILPFDMKQLEDKIQREKNEDE